jgi:hypothetical protein
MASFERLHPVLMAPLVILLWLAGTAILLTFASAIDIPGVNEHGAGLLVALVVLLGAIIAAIFHIGRIIRRRRELHR